MRVLKIAAAVSAILIFSVVAAAQITTATPPPRTEPGSIRGRVLMPDGAPVTESIKITLRVLRGDQSVLYTDEEGMFQIDSLSPGSYTVEAEADRERTKYENVSERVQVYPRSPSFVTLYLKEKDDKAKEKPASETVSAAELEQKVPAAASKEFDRATKSWKDGKPDEAVAHLRKAIEIYPDYLKAHNDLGTYFLSQGKLDDAATELRAAVRIDPKAFNPRLNLGIVLVQQRDFRGAAENLDSALTLDATSPAAHLYAGFASVGLRDFERAEKELSTAYRLGGSQFALAQLQLGRIYMSRGENERALKAFETYLQDQPNAPNADEVRLLIAKLR
ncbi:MAG TPA: tetratricopeptide repeat protein [Pyrinomonadaceae bacterium]|nr:tetratricopeptide repeat protein [Pyrinomonadaceae bacterium]